MSSAWSLEAAREDQTTHFLCRQDPFGGLRDWSADSPAHSPFTNTRTAPPSRPPARNDDGSRANDTSFLDGILHATAPRRRRPEPQPQSSTDAQDTLTRRHPADLPRETYRPTLSQTTTRQPHSDHRPRQGTFGYIPNALVEFSDDDDSTPQSTRPSTRVSDRASEELVTLEDTDEEDIMPITRRCNNNGGSATVDLTSGASASTSQQRARGRKRSADSSTTTEGRATKRGRTSQEDIEEIDLSNDAPSAEEELLQQRQKEAIKLQQASEEDNGPFKIGQRTCIICMENFTNCTIASCGEHVNVMFE